MNPATVELLLLGLKVGMAAYKQISLMDMEELPPEVKQMLITHRDNLGLEILRLDGFGGR